MNIRFENLQRWTSAREALAALNREGDIGQPSQTALDFFSLFARIGPQKQRTPGIPGEGGRYRLKDSRGWIVPRQCDREELLGGAKSAGNVSVGHNKVGDSQVLQLKGDIFQRITRSIRTGQEPLQRDLQNGSQGEQLLEGWYSFPLLELRNITLMQSST